MRTFNEEFALEEVPADVRKSFKDGKVEKRLLHAGHELYRLSSHPLIGAGGKVTEWWSSVPPLDLGDPGFAGSLGRAANVDSSLRDFARARSAVTQQWNDMEKLVRVRLAQSTWVFVGRCASQPVDARSGPDVRWIGGAWQAWIPNLTRAEIVPLPG